MESMALTNREKASLYSETCSSVKESAWGRTRQLIYTGHRGRSAPQGGGAFSRSSHDEKEGEGTMMIVVGGEVVNLEGG